MENRDQDIIEILKEKEAYHLDQISRIHIALKALQGTPENLNIKKVMPSKIQWSKEIPKLLDEFDELTPVEIRTKLAEKGIAQALIESNKSTIYATLSRLVNKGELIRTDEGKYTKQKPKLHLRTETSNEKEEDHQTDDHSS